MSNDRSHDDSGLSQKRDHENQGDHEHHGHDDMGHRGVSRPMAEGEMSGDQLSGHKNRECEDHEPHQGHGHEEGSDGHHMSREQRLDMLRMHHKNTLWVPWTVLLLGLWVLAAPFTFGYLNSDLWVDPSGGRGAWWSKGTHTELRAWLMTVSDILSGCVLLIFGWRTLTPNRPVSWWICCLVGVWLTIAPALFWAPTAASYVSDTIAGMLLIALTILIPGMPNMVMYMQHGPPTPPGWSYNPSSWPQRWIMIVLGFVGFVVSRYLAAYQLGYITQVWDPFFGFQQGTKQVLDSKMSHAWPISDAALGTLSYTFEFLMGYMGSPARWRTMPWMVAFFGVLVIPLGLTHILLVSSMPAMVGHWCTLCLLAALIMLPMIPLEADEVVAMGQHMVEAKRRGDRGGSLWQIFWKGGSADGCTPDERSPMLTTLPEKPGRVFLASIWGMSFPWTLAASAVLGMWLMLAPTVFGTEKPAANVGHLGGAWIVTVSVISMGEVLRLGRWLNVLLGLGIAVVPWLLEGSTTAGAVNATVVGLLVAALAIPRGRKTETYGLWDKLVR